MIYKKLNKVELTIAITISVIIFSFYLFFNFNYLSGWVDENRDVLTYDYYVKLGIPQYLYNPHHIAFDWLGKVMLNHLIINGYTGSSMLILQMRNLIISSIGLGLFFFFFFKISKKYLLSFFLVAIIAFTEAYWMYSQINDTPIIHSVMIMLMFFAVIYFPQAKHKILYSIFLGFAHSINIFFHQYDLIFIFVIFFVLVFSKKLLPVDVQNENKELVFITRKKVNLQNYWLIKFGNIKYFLIYFSVFLFIVVIAYYYVGIVLLGLTLDINKAQDFNKIKNASYFFNWLVLYAKIDYWGKGFLNENLFHQALNGILTYFYQPHCFKGEEIQYNFQDFYKISSLLPNMICSFIIFILLFSICFCAGMYKKYKYIFLANLIFIVIYVAFSCWWQPDYREFWIATMFAFWLLSFFVLNYIIDKLKSIEQLIKIFIYSYLLLFAFLLFYFNFTGFLYPNSSTALRKYNIINNTEYEKIIKPDLEKKIEYYHN